MAQKAQQITIKTAYLPEESKEIITKNFIENNYLMYNRFLIDYDIKEKDKKGKQRKQSIKNVPYARIFFKESKDKDYGFLKTITNDINSISQSFKFRRKFSFKPDKIAVGTGCESPFGSTSLITLHPVYGIPFIPSSAIKGVVRNSYIQENHDGCEDEALADVNFIKLFGSGADNDSQASQGKLVFLDAFPEKDFEIYWDVQTPHFKDYYDDEGKKEPTDDINPVPLYFPIIKNASFLICVCSLEDIELNYDIFKIAFSKYGIGAKTSLGYGLGKLDCK